MSSTRKRKPLKNSAALSVKVLGCAGGQQPHIFTSSYLIDSNFLVDAGGACLNLTLQQQRKIDYVLITHSHLDHIKDLAFLVDNLVGVRQTPISVYASQITIDAIMKHLFNDVIWPNFTRIPSPETPIIQFIPLPTTGEPVNIGGYEVRCAEVNHIPGAVGYVITKGQSSVVFTGDTNNPEKIWKLARQTPTLKAIFTEISFPSTMVQLAELSRHFCPMTFELELDKIEDLHVPIYIAHFKPGMESALMTEFRNRRLGQRGVKILKQGTVFKF